MNALRQHPWKLAALAALLLGAAGVAFADREGYRQIQSSDAPTELRGGAIDGADSLSWTSPIDTAGSDRTVFSCEGNPTGAVSARLSVSGATTTISVGLYHVTGSTYTFMGIAAVQTATGSDDTDANSEYPAKSTIFFDTAGATHFEVRKTDPSDSATVRLFAWLYGLDSKAALR